MFHAIHRHTGVCGDNNICIVGHVHLWNTGVPEMAAGEAQGMKCWRTVTW